MAEVEKDKEFDDIHESTDNVLLDYFINEIKFDSKNKRFSVEVEPYNEIDITERESIDKNDTPVNCNNETIIFNYNKFNIDISDWKEHFGTKTPKLINKFSGTKISIPLGEGLLDFCYADFNKNMDALYSFFKFYKECYNPVFDYTSEVNDEDMYNYKLDLIRNASMAFGDTFFYSTLYSAIYPPFFLTPEEEGLKHYINYLFSLQKEFLNMIEFCFDKEFYPNVLNKLSPSTRFLIHCNRTKTSSRLIRTENFDINYSYDENGENYMTIDPDTKKFADKYKIDTLLLASIQKGSTIDISYSCTNIYDMLMLELTKMFECNISFKKCKNCGRYFIKKGNYESNYCNRVIEGSNKTCQQFAAQKNYKNKISSDEAWKAYNKYYKRYFARAKVGTIKKSVFKKWQYEATFKRDECLAGRLSIEEYIEWLDRAFATEY